MTMFAFRSSSSVNQGFKRVYSPVIEKRTPKKGSAAGSKGDNPYKVLPLKEDL
jgi:hypothetical protein